MKKQPASITVQGCEIAIQPTDYGDYLSLTDMAKRVEGENHVGNWLRTKSTIESLGVWETLSNPDFKSIEFEGLRSRSGSNAFAISPSQWIERTAAVGLLVKMGRYGSGVFAHEEIATDFAMWLSPEFKVYVVKEFRRLKDAEADATGIQWSLKRMLSKANYHVQTDAIKDTLIPAMKLKPSDEWIAYTSEADLLNQVVFGMSAKEWRAQNPTARKNENMRDNAAWISLAVISNLESQNATMIRDEIPKMQRFYKLSEVARQQFESLSKSAAMREQARKLDAGVKSLNAPKPPPSTKPPATGGELKKGFGDIKRQIASIPDPPRKDQPDPKMDEVIKRIVRVPPPPKNKGEK